MATDPTPAPLEQDATVDLAEWVPGDFDHFADAFMYGSLSNSVGPARAPTMADFQEAHDWTVMSDECRDLARAVAHEAGLRARQVRIWVERVATLRSHEFIARHRSGRLNHMARVEIDDHFFEDAAPGLVSIHIANRLGATLRRQLLGPAWPRPLVAFFHLVLLDATHRRLAAYVTQPGYDRDVADLMIRFEEWFTAGYRKEYGA